MRSYCRAFLAWHGGYVSVAAAKTRQRVAALPSNSVSCRLVSLKLVGMLTPPPAPIQLMHLACVQIVRSHSMVPIVLLALSGPAVSSSRRNSLSMNTCPATSRIVYTAITARYGLMKAKDHIPRWMKSTIWSVSMGIVLVISLFSSPSRRSSGTCFMNIM